MFVMHLSVKCFLSIHNTIYVRCSFLFVEECSSLNLIKAVVFLMQLCFPFLSYVVYLPECPRDFKISVYLDMQMRRWNVLSNTNRRHFTSVALSQLTLSDITASVTVNR